VAREGIVTTHKHLSIAQRDIGLSARSTTSAAAAKSPRAHRPPVTVAVRDVA
jgi:hypothetical protein